MKLTKTKWRVSTINIFLDNCNGSIANELLYNIDYLSLLLEDLKKEGGYDKNYYNAIQDIKNWIQELKS